MSQQERADTCTGCLHTWTPCQRAWCGSCPACGARSAAACWAPLLHQLGSARHLSQPLHSKLLHLAQCCSAVPVQLGCSSQASRMGPGYRCKMSESLGLSAALACAGQSVPDSGCTPEGRAGSSCVCSQPPSGGKGCPELDALSCGACALPGLLAGFCSTHTTVSCPRQLHHTQAANG